MHSNKHRHSLQYNLSGSQSRTCQDGKRIFTNGLSRVSKVFTRSPLIEDCRLQIRWVIVAESDVLAFLIVPILMGYSSYCLAVCHRFFYSSCSLE